VPSHARSVARQLKEVKLEKAKQKANLDQERRLIEAVERRTHKEIEADERQARIEMARGEAELKRA
jgi:hypothetical protein